MTAAGNPALLFVVTDLDPAHEAAVNRWYDSRHVPQRQALPGFISAERYELIQGAHPGQIGPKYAALYDTESPDALKTNDYKALSQPPIQTGEDREMVTYFRNNMRCVMTLISETVSDSAASYGEPQVLNAVGLQPHTGYEEEYNAWYDEEHIPFIIKVPGVLRVRRFRGVEGPLQYLTLWEHADVRVRGTEAFSKAAETPWTFRMREHCDRPITAMYRPLVPAGAGTNPV
ncbi:MAG TPA: hypothetical protein VK821_07975 [Dehalococcoidia bacterium]|nr:hypothetical protein [Dehalococcoidia bacterium]